MGEASINIIHKGLIQLLDKTFKCRVYGDEIKQDFKEPCFFVPLLDQSERQLLSQRYKRTHLFDVHYFPAKGREDALDMADRLYGLLALIPINGDLYRGTDMNMKYIDGVLHFFANYDFHVLKPVQEPLMEVLEVPDVRTKG